MNRSIGLCSFHAISQFILSDAISSCVIQQTNDQMKRKKLKKKTRRKSCESSSWRDMEIAHRVWVREKLWENGGSDGEREREREVERRKYICIWFHENDSRIIFVFSFRKSFLFSFQRERNDYIVLWIGCDHRPQLLCFFFFFYFTSVCVRVFFFCYLLDFRGRKKTTAQEIA